MGEVIAGLMLLLLAMGGVYAVLESRRRVAVHRRAPVDALGSEDHDVALARARAYHDLSQSAVRELTTLLTRDEMGVPFLTSTDRDRIQQLIDKFYGK